MRLWGGRFGDGPDARMADFTRSIEVDAELAIDDIAGSIAHVRGLGRAGLLTDEEVQVLERGLVSLRDDVVAGSSMPRSVARSIDCSRVRPMPTRIGATTSRPGSRAWTAMSKRTWSLPLPVQPWATASAPSFRATSTSSWASSGRARAVASG